MEYRGIQLHESVRLYKYNGEYNQQIKSSLDELANLLEKNNDILLSEYRGVQEKVLIKRSCGHTPHLIKPNHYKSGQGCPICSGCSPEQAKKDLLELIKLNNHKLLSEYISNKIKVLIDFNCSHEPSWIRPDNYKCGHGCPKCGKIRISKKAEEELILLVKQNNHKLLSKYRGWNIKVLIDFNCKHKPHWIRFNDYKHGYGCPICSESKGVKIICKWLDENKIEYETEYHLPNKKWRYDIFIPSRNLIVEVHGIQHFRTVGHFKQTVKEQSKRDTEKWSYATSLKYEYLEVDYKEGKPELALERFLKAFNEFGRVEKPNTQLSLF